MPTRSGISAALLLAAFAFSACDFIDRLGATKIKDVLDHPRDYENKDITVYGTVTGAASFLVIKFFEIEDDTGAIKVVTDRVLPQKGEKIRVTGRMESIELGLERVIVLREKRTAEKDARVDAR